MSKTVDFYFDFGSPTTYLANTQLPNICSRNHAELNYVPVLLGGIFKASGNQSPVMLPAKGAHMAVDLQRYAEHYQVPISMNPYFPINTLTLMRMAVGIQLDMPEKLSHYIEMIFKALWIDAKNMGDAEVVANTLIDAGFDPEALLALSARADVKEKLKINTEKAVSLGAYGAPTMFIGDEMFFGQDRIFMIDALLSKDN